MSTGGLIGAVAGGVIGFFVGGPVGAFVGAAVGFSAGMLVDPMTPDVRTAGTPKQDLQITPNTVGSLVPDLLGTAEITGFLLAYGLERAVPVYQEPVGGKGGDEPEPVLKGYEYYMTWALGFCAGQADAIYTMYKDEDVVWEGSVVRPVSGGEETISVSGLGSVTFYFGTVDQVANSIMGQIIGDVTLNSPMRCFVWALFNDCYIGSFNRMPTIRMVMRKTPQLSFGVGNELVSYIDYNPAHAIWFILNQLTGLPESWLHTVDFTSFSLSLLQEERGLSILFDQQQDAMTWLEEINRHVDCILRYGMDGKFHPKLIREDYVVGTLPIVDESIMLEEPMFDRKAWIDTINEIKVQYTQISRPIEPWVFDFAPQDMVFDGTYFYLCGAKQSAPGKVDPYVVKLDMNFQFVDSGIYDDGLVNVNKSYWGIRESGNDIILGGYLWNGSYNVAFLQKKPKSNLQNTDWTYTYSFAGRNCWIQEPEVDDDFVYGAGAEYPMCLVIKLNKNDGSLVWLRDNFGTSRVGILQEGAYAYPIGHSSGWLSVQKVPKTNPDGYTDHNFGSTGVFYRGGIYDGHIYVDGRTPGFGDTQGITMKIRMSDMVEIWRYLRNTLPGGDDINMKCKCDGSNVFTIGQSGSPLVTILEKLDMDGNLVLSKNLGNANYRYAIIVPAGDYFYIANLSMERRLKSTLEIG